MKILQFARLPLLALVILTTLIVTSSAFAAAPAPVRKVHKLYSAHMSMDGGGCQYSQATNWASED